MVSINEDRALNCKAIKIVDKVLAINVKQLKATTILTVCKTSSFNAGETFNKLDQFTNPQQIVQIAANGTKISVKQQ